MQELHATLKTPKYILELLIDEKITELNEKELLKEVRSLCGEYAGRNFLPPLTQRSFHRAYDGFISSLLIATNIWKNRVYFFS
jgi:hypothetical protein